MDRGRAGHFRKGIGDSDHEAGAEGRHLAGGLFPNAQAFSATTGNVFKAKPTARWAPCPGPTNQGRKRRRGRADEQAVVYAEIQAKTVKAKRARTV